MLEKINMTTAEEGFTTTNSLQEPTRRALNFDGSFGKFISQHKVYHIKKDEVYSQRVDTIKREMFSQKSVRQFIGDSSAFVMGAMFLASVLN